MLSDMCEGVAEDNLLTDLYVVLTKHGWLMLSMGVQALICLDYIVMSFSKYLFVW